MSPNDQVKADTVETLCEHYHVDLAHAQHVAELAVTLFDALQHVHQLPAGMRRMAEAGALLHNVGMSVDEPNHHLAGRDIIAAATLQGFDGFERATLACMAAFHRKSVDPADEPLMRQLSAAQQRTTLILSALVRVADGLDYSQSQATTIASLEVEDGNERAQATATGTEAAPDTSHAQIRIRVEGPCSHEDAARASRKADLWNTLFPAMRFIARMARPGVTREDTLAQAGRRILRHQSEALISGDLQLKPGELIGSRPVHSLYVMTRRLRVTLRVFKPYYEPKATRLLVKGVRALADQVSPARELDVSLSALKRYLSTCDEETRAGIQPLLVGWRAQRKTARVALARRLQSEPHIQWLDHLSAFVKSDAYDQPGEPGQLSLVRQAAEYLLAQHLAEVKAYDTLMATPSMEQIGSLRIAIERLRYIADALREVLPRERTSKILTRCIAAQEEYVALEDLYQTVTRALQFVSVHQNSGLPEALRSIMSFAEYQQRAVEEHMSRWHSYLDPLLVL